MTRKHFELIASVLAAHRPDPSDHGQYAQGARDALNAVAFHLSRDLATVNAHFDASKFVTVATAGEA